MAGDPRPAPSIRASREKTGGKVGSPATMAVPTAAAMNAGLREYQAASTGTAIECADGHHRQRLQEDAGHGDARIDPMAADQAGAEDDDHRLAGHVFSQVADVVGPQGLQQADILPQRSQGLEPEEAFGQQGYEIKAAGEGQPPGVQRPWMLAELVPRQYERAADEPEHDRDDQGA